MATRRVVVTGIGIVSPLGVGREATWNALLKGVIGVRALNAAEDKIPKLEDLPVKIAATVDKSLIKPPSQTDNWTRVSPFIQYALLAADEALQDAHWYPSTSTEKETTGVYVGTGIGCVEEIVQAHETIHRGGGIRRLSPHFIPKILGNLATGNISIRYGLQGPNHASITACASGAHAIGDSYRMIKYGDADVMVTGGTEACINEISLAGFSRLRALSTKYNDDPMHASRPFDTTRDGFVMGEGAAVLILEEMEHAMARGARIYAEVSGYGMAGDAHHITAPCPEGSGALRSMQAALKNAKAYVPGGFSEVEHVNAHATSTPVGDLIEGQALQRLITQGKAQTSREKDLYVTSTKGATGHLLGAAGAIEAAFTALSLYNQIIPPTANLDNPDEASQQWDFHLVGKGGVGQGHALPLTFQHAMSNSFGFGGVNVSLIFSRFSKIK